jgi:pimeloyl-ACP methyl ester carboxylesterase
MPTFHARDGTRLAYRLIGEGEPLICLPGGPMQASAYLGDLGGLPAHRSLVLLDLRGTGESAVPDDPRTYRCDRLVDDVEALREHLGQDRVEVLAHSAGASVAVLYAARHPRRVARLALVTPSPRVVDVEVSDSARRQVAELRRGERWFPDAFAALERIWSEDASDADWSAITPFTYGRWDASNRAHAADAERQRNDAAAALYYPADGLDPPATRVVLAELEAQVLLVAGEYDVALPPDCAARYAALFRSARLAAQKGAGHYPWLDDPDRFVDIVMRFLR